MMAKTEPQIVGYFKGEPIFVREEMPPPEAAMATKRSAPSNTPAPQTRPTNLVGLFTDLMPAIANFEDYLVLLHMRLNSLTMREKQANISPTPPSAERQQALQQIALTSTAITYLRSLVASASVLFPTWTE
jgi:hypothetical protein